MQEENSDGNWSLLTFGPASRGEAPLGVTAPTPSFAGRGRSSHSAFPVFTRLSTRSVISIHRVWMISAYWPRRGHEAPRQHSAPPRRCRFESLMMAADCVRCNAGDAFGIEWPRLWLTCSSATRRKTARGPGSWPTHCASGMGRVVGCSRLCRHSVSRRDRAPVTIREVRGGSVVAGVD